MKSLIPRLITAIVLFTFPACQKTEQALQSIPNVAALNIRDQVAYIDRHLRAITEELAILCSEKEFVSFVHTEVKKKFDGEYEVLINDLKKNSRWSGKLGSPKMSNALNAFKNIDGNNYYPQVYIPMFQHEEDMKEDKDYSLPQGLGEQIIYIYYNGAAEIDTATNTAESYPGYILNSNNQLEYWGMVNEAYANENEVWIISTNESVNNNGYICPDPFVPESCNPNPPDNPPGGGCTGPDCDPNEYPASATPIHPDMGLHNPVSFKIEYMIIKDHKESWLAGASEIAIRAKLNCHNNLELGNPRPAPSVQYKSDQCSNYIGNKIYKFKRKDIRNQNSKLVNYTLQSNWPSQYYLSDPVYFDYVIFERDIWPATLNKPKRTGRKDLFHPPYTDQFSDAWEQGYRSQKKTGTTWNYPYVTGDFVNNILLATSQHKFYATGYVNNEYITFNTVGN